MSQQTRGGGEGSAERRSRLSADVEGRSVGFWIVVAVMIAAVTLGFGAWWVWGLGQAVSMDDGTAVGGPEASVAEVAEALTATVSRCPC